MKTPYRHYDVLDKWSTPSFDAPTRAVLTERLHVLPPRRFFTPEEWTLLQAVTARVLPQLDRIEPVPIVPWLDEQLWAGRGEGFRHEGTAPMRQAWRDGLAAIEAEAQRRHGCGFAALHAASGDALLGVLAQGGADPALWRAEAAQHFFIHILVKSIVAIYYAHPAAWSEIGFGGPASPRGYVRLGADERDAWEARERE